MALSSACTQDKAVRALAEAFSISRGTVPHISLTSCASSMSTAGARRYTGAGTAPELQRLVMMPSQSWSYASWHRVLFPDPPRPLPYARAISITLRTVHIAAIGILLGGHTFAVPSTRLLPWLSLSIISGAGLIGLELYSSCKWLYQGKGVLVMLKLLLIAAVAVFWEQRLWLLLAALVLGSVGSHMPGRLRYYSLIHRRVI